MPPEAAVATASTQPVAISLSTHEQHIPTSLVKKVVLSVLSIIGGVIGLAAIYSGYNELKTTMKELTNAVVELKVQMATISTKVDMIANGALSRNKDDSPNK